MKRSDVLIRLICEHGLKSGAEIGVRRGATTAAVLSACPDVHWIAVDDWRTTPDDPAKVPQAVHRRVFLNEVMPRFPDRLTLIEKDSAVAAIDVGDVDLVFIDADHSFEGVCRDIAFWGPKARHWITGHDYGHPQFPGVRQAVDISFEGVETAEDYTWLVRRS